MLYILAGFITPSDLRNDDLGRCTRDGIIVPHRIVWMGGLVVGLDPCSCLCADGAQAVREVRGEGGEVDGVLGRGDDGYCAG